MKKLFTNETDNNTTKANLFTSIGQGLGGTVPLGIHCYGTWGTATITVYITNNPAVTGVALSELVFTGNDGYVNLDLPGEVAIYAELTGATGGEDLSCWIAGIGND